MTDLLLWSMFVLRDMKINTMVSITTTASCSLNSCCLKQERYTHSVDIVDHELLYV